MMSGRRTVLIPVGVITLASLGTLSAQQPPPTTTRPSQIRVDPRESRAVTQGFSVVLVVADLQASTGQDDVPPAARRALADMKDFLPYKSYRLLDAAWILGEGNQGVATRLRGPDENEYELHMNTSPTRAVGLAQGDQNRSPNAVFVRFSLREPAFHESTPEPDRATAEQIRLNEANRRTLEQQVIRLESELRSEQARREIGTANESKVRELEKDLVTAREKLSRMTRSNVTRAASAPRGRTSALIDTSFTMDIGETVVVGTSRLKGNSRALIALLTAVPSKGSRAPIETR
jgi:hypothetical protein